MLIANGTLELDLYCLQQRKQESFVLTPENVYRNGKLYYGSAAMFEWSPGTFYKMRTETEGCTLITFVTEGKQVNQDQVENSLRTTETKDEFLEHSAA
jgi:hypothetical protein